MAENGYLLEVKGLKTYFAIRKGVLRRTVGHVKAVDGVSFGVARGRTFGLVGETGSGKTTVARTVARLVPATEGTVLFDSANVLSAGRRQLHRLRRDIGMIFQDPYGSLNPRMTVGAIVGEPLRVQLNVRGGELADRAAGLLSAVGLSPDHLNRYPHEFSGGQRQRIGIARALALSPRLVMCDEPVSALDVSIQSQILNLLKDLQQQLGLTYLFIAHDLAVVEFFCDVVAVMYMGRIVEIAGAGELYANPAHPYTRLLMASIPEARPPEGPRKPLRRGIASVGGAVPRGCPFSPRCPEADETCRGGAPELVERTAGSGHLVACWRRV
jgi:oligopeptide/dipeptide ABC transporter ATP-binding protein